MYISFHNSCHITRSIDTSDIEMFYIALFHIRYREIKIRRFKVPTPYGGKEIGTNNLSLIRYDSYLEFEYVILKNKIKYEDKLALSRKPLRQLLLKYRTSVH